MASLLPRALIASASNAFVFVTTTKVHPTWFPFVWAPTAHAARISMAYQFNARKAGGGLSWGTYLAGYLIMCWGGTIISNLLLGIPPPMFYLFGPWINYLTVHLALTTLFHVYPQALNPSLLNTLFLPLDAILRTNSVIMTLSLLSRPQIPKEYVNSPLTHMILGAIASAGGGLSASTLGTWTSSWAMSTPGILRAGAGWDGTLDVWGGALIAVVYSTATSHPAFASFRTFLLPIVSSPAPTSSLKAQQLQAQAFFSLPTLDAKAFSTIVFMALFTARVYKTLLKEERSQRLAAKISGDKKKN